MGTEAEDAGDRTTEDDAADRTSNVKKLSTTMATVTIMKGMIGAGILSLPSAFSQVGLIIAVPCMLLIGSLCGFACWRLAECVELMKKLSGKFPSGKLEEADSDDSSEEEDAAAFKPGAEAVMATEDYGLGSMASVSNAAFGMPGVIAVALAINIGQLGCCLAYIVIIISTLEKDSLLGKVLPEIWLRVIICGMLCLLVLLKQLIQLAWLSTAALLTYAYTFIALIRWGSDQLVSGKAPDPIGAWAPRGVSNLGAFVGTAVFAQAGIVMSQYVYEGMDLPTPTPFKVALGASFGMGSCLYTFVGAFAFMAYGDEIKQIFPHNFPENSLDTMLAEAILCVVLFLTFVLQIFPILTFGEATLLGINMFKDEEGMVEKMDSDSSSDSDVVKLGRWDQVMSVLLRWSVVVGLSVLAKLIPKVTCITGISGSVAYSSLSFTIPAICHLKLRGRSIKHMELVTDAILIIFGVATMLVGVLTVDC